jgi:hypothetical protein
MKTRLRRALRATSQWCRGHRHDAICVQQAALEGQILGCCAYYGITGLSLRGAADLAQVVASAVEPGAQGMVVLGAAP